jgi:hypothetical protein
MLANNCMGVAVTRLCQFLRPGGCNSRVGVPVYCYGKQRTGSAGLDNQLPAPVTSDPGFGP